jgi:hypothetical protein
VVLPDPAMQGCCVGKQLGAAALLAGVDEIDDDEQRQLGVMAEGHKTRVDRSSQPGGSERGSGEQQSDGLVDVDQVGLGATRHQ